MSKERQENFGKERKSDARKDFEEQENAGRFAGDDLDAQVAQSKAEEQIRAVEGTHPEFHTVREVIPEDAPPRLDDAQANNETNEAQNISSHRAGPGALSNNDKDVDHAINKANQNRE